MHFTMERRIGTRREPLVVEGVNPSDGKLCSITMSLSKIKVVARRSLGQLKECAYVVPMILQKPSAIFEGLKRDADEPYNGYGWRCYCGIPSMAYTRDGTERAPWPNQVFLVFVTEDLVAYNWYWYQCSDDDPNLPDGHITRFRERVL